MEYNIKGNFPIKLCCVFCILISKFQAIGSLYITNIVVPPVVDVRNSTTLSCAFNMNGNILNSVKWYKDQKEFFRYAPLNIPKQSMFNVDGVQLSPDHVCNDKFCTIHLENLSKRTSGEYRCEVSGDAPEFKIVHETANMTIAVLPRRDPVIFGLEKSYYDGEFLMANCSSDMSSPAPSLTWYINDQKAPNEILQPVIEHNIDAYGFFLSYRILEIRFTVNRTRFHFFGDSNRVQLKCVSKLRLIPSEIRETNHDFYVTSLGDLNNQKLTNWRNSACSLHSKFPSTNLLFIFIIIISLHRAIRAIPVAV